MDKESNKTKTNKKLLAFIIIFISIVFIERINLIVGSDIVPAKFVSCDSKWVEDTESYNEQQMVQYMPLAVSNNGDKAVGSIMMPNRSICSQIVGKDVLMLVDKDDHENNKIFSFIQFFAFPSFLLAFPVLYLIGLYSVAGTRVVCFVFYAGAIYAILLEVGMLEKHFPKAMTGKNISQSEAALRRCADTSLRNEGITSRSEIKKLVCQEEEISELTSISDLISLEELYLQGNELQSLWGLHPFRNLKKISVASNKTLTSTKGIEYASNLVEFQGNISSISDLSGMDKLKKLKVIGLM